MKFTRFLLVLVFLAVSVVYTIQDVAGRFSDADEPPTLTCGSEILDISVQDEDSALLTGITASDPQDGDISGNVLVTGISRLLSGNTAKVSYAVFDSDHNMATLTRTIRYTDYRLPRFSLEEPLIYSLSEPVQLLDRLHANDVVDGSLTGQIRVTDSTAAYGPGVRYITAQVTNSLGDTAWLTLPVILMNDGEEVVDVELTTYLVYLKQGDSFSPGRYLKGASWRGDSVSAANVSIDSQVDTSVPGTYYAEYTCVYGSRSGTVYLTVVVE